MLHFITINQNDEVNTVDAENKFSLMTQLRESGNNAKVFPDVFTEDEEHAIANKYALCISIANKRLLLYATNDTLWDAQKTLSIANNYINSYHEGQRTYNEHVQKAVNEILNDDAKDIIQDMITAYFEYLPENIDEFIDITGKAFNKTISREKRGYNISKKRSETLIQDKSGNYIEDYRQRLSALYYITEFGGFDKNTETGKIQSLIQTGLEKADISETKLEILKELLIGYTHKQIREKYNITENQLIDIIRKIRRNVLSVMKKQYPTIYKEYRTIKTINTEDKDGNKVKYNVLENL